MKKTIFTLSITLTLLIFANANSTYITKEEIQQSGLMRLSDIFLLIDDWDISTIDGITYQASPMGLSSYQHQDWKIFLDGNPIDIDIFGTKSLDRIPVDISQIDNIRITSQPSIAAGQKSVSGQIEIITKRPNKDISAIMRTGFGNETGDPGPYYYTDKSTPNIDKVGNIIAGGLSSAADSSYFNLAYKREIGYPTDQAIYNRNNVMAGGHYPRQKLEAYYFDFGRSFKKNSHTFKVGLSTFDDFYFLRQYGREIPVNTKLVYFGNTGQIWIKKRPLLRYRFSYSSNAQQKRENSSDLDLSWKHETVRANIESKYYWWKNLVGRFGIGFNHQAVSTKYILDKTTINEATIYGSLKYDISNGKKITFNGLVNIENKDVGFLFLSDISLQFDKSRILKALFSYSRTFPSESNSIWYWQESGYNFINEYSRDYQINGQLRPYNKFTADISYNQQIVGYTFIKFSGYYRSFSDIPCEGQFVTEPPDYYAPGNLILETDCSGQIVGGKINVDITLFKELDVILFKKLDVKLSARYQSPLSDNNLFDEVWNTIPKTKITGTIIFTPINNFHLLTRLKYTGATKWVDYDNTDDATNNTHNIIEIDPFVSVDLTLQKYFNNRKIRTSFSIRNLLNNTVRYHPIGARFDLSYLAQLEIMLN